MSGSELMIVDASREFGPVYLGVVVAFAVSCVGLVTSTVLPQTLYWAFAHRDPRRSAVSHR